MYCKVLYYYIILYYSNIYNSYYFCLVTIRSTFPFIYLIISYILCIKISSCFISCNGSISVSASTGFILSRNVLCVYGPKLSITS